MKSDFRAFAIACLIYTSLVGVLLWRAFFFEDDSSIIVFWSAMPSSILVGLIDYAALRDAAASVLRQEVTDNLAAAFGVTFVWGLGCLQWGLLGILIGRSWRFVRGAEA